MRKRITVLLIALTIIVEGCGCMSLFQRTSSSNANDIALAYMEEKYGEPFTYAGAAGNSMSGTHELYVACASMPNKRIHVSVNNYTSSRRTISDNYLMHKYESEIISFLQECAATEFTHNIVYYTTTDHDLSADTPADATFEETLLSDGVHIYATIEVPDSELENMAQVNRLVTLSCRDLSQYQIAVIAVEESLYGHLSYQELRARLTHRGYCRAAIFSQHGSHIDSEWIEKEA